MKVEWSPVAARELRDIVDYVAERNLVAADKLEGEMLDAALSLAHFPRRGRLSKIPGLRELKVRRRPYFLAYLVGGETVTVLRVVHTSRDWPPPEGDPDA